MILSPTESRPLSFDGAVYDPEKDRERLTKQLVRVFTALRSGFWFTLREIENMTGDPQASISAQLRHLRKPEFGGYIIEKRRRGRDGNGTWEYRLRIPEPGIEETGQLLLVM